jgi:hypothetical protein
MHGGAFELFNDWMESAALDIGMTLKSQLDMRLVGYSLAEAFGKPRLSNAGLAR